MKAEYITTNSQQTQKLGELLADEIKKGQIICLSGELGSGKTTFTQGLLKSLKTNGPHTSPTFVIMKKYKRKMTNKIQDIFHIDAYRVNSKDVLDLGWEEIIADNKNIIIIEWADRICDIIPKYGLWIKFQWLDKNKRKIIFSNKKY